MLRHCSLQNILQGSRQSCLGLPFSSKNCLFPWGPGPTSDRPTWFLGPTRVLNLNDTSIGSAVFAGLTTVTDRQTADRQTDIPRWSVTTGCVYVRSSLLRCGLTIRLIKCRLIRLVDSPALSWIWYLSQTGSLRGSLYRARCAAWSVPAGGWSDARSRHSLPTPWRC